MSCWATDSCKTYGMDKINKFLLTLTNSLSISQANPKYSLHDDKLPGPCPVGLITSTEDVTLLSNSESHDSKLPSVNCYSLASCQEYCSLTAIPRSSAERDTLYDGLPEESDVLSSPNYSDQHRALQLTRAIVMSCLDSWFSQTTGLAVISS